MPVGTVYILTLYTIMIIFESFSHSFASLIYLSLSIHNTFHRKLNYPEYRILVHY
jgi:hypothetical protein